MYQMQRTSANKQHSNKSCGRVVNLQSIETNSPCPTTDFCWRQWEVAAPRRWKRCLQSHSSCSEQSSSSGTTARTHLWSGCRPAAPRCWPEAHSLVSLWWAQMDPQGTPACRLVVGENPRRLDNKIKYLARRQSSAVASRSANQRLLSDCIRKADAIITLPF